MRFLALDTSTDHLSLTLYDQGQLHSRAWQVGQRHAELTLTAIAELLAETGHSLAQLDGLALAIGPGSFTGLRIGCGLIQGLALARDLPVLAVGSLEALAADSAARQCIATLDARMGQAYYACYQRQDDGELTTVIAPQVGAAADLPLPNGDGWQGLGGGFAAYPLLAERLGGQLAAVDGGVAPLASGVAKLAALRWAQRQPADTLELFYVRNKVALKSHERNKA